MAASIDKKRLSRMYGYGSNELSNLRRMNEFRKTQVIITTAKIEMKTQEPPKVATLSAILWPKVSCSEKSFTTFLEIGSLSAI